MMTIEQLETAERNALGEAAAANGALHIIQSQLREARSRAFIALMEIKREDVQLCNADGLPFFFTLGDFKHWLKFRPPKELKKWATWNGQIHSTAALLHVPEVGK